MSRFFFDTYALIEVVKGNPDYKRFSDAIVVTSKFNLIEFYYSALCEFSKEVARLLYLKFKECARIIEDEMIFDAMDMKQEYKKRHISYVDCLGYTYAKKNGIPFLTGDNEFKDLPSVEFVK